MSEKLLSALGGCEYSNSPLIKVQGIRDCKCPASNGPYALHSYILTPKAQKSLLKNRIGVRARDSGHPQANNNLQQLRQHAQGLGKIKPDKIPAGRGEERIGAPLFLGEQLLETDALGGEAMFFKSVAPGR